MARALPTIIHNGIALCGSSRERGVGHSGRRRAMVATNRPGRWLRRLAYAMVSEALP